MAFTITDRALEEIRRVLEEAKQNYELKAFLEDRGISDTSLFIRVKLTAHGCGLIPELSLEIDKEANDEIVEYPGVTIRMDSRSATYLAETTLDYEKKGLLGGFKFIHPTNFHSCGCGRSFTPAPKK